MWIMYNSDYQASMINHQYLRLPDGLLSLCLPDLRLLVPLGHDVIEGGTSDGSLELGGLSGPLLGNLFSLTLLVLSPVQHCPVDLTRVALHVVGTFTFLVKKLEHLIEQIQSFLVTIILNI